MASAKEYRVVCIGEANVGKTSIIHYWRGQKDPMPPNTLSSIYYKMLVNHAGIDCHIALCDTGGQEKFRSVTRSFYRDAVAAVVVFDMSDRETLAKLDYWITDFREQIKDGFVIIAGNKADLPHEVSDEVCQQYEHNYDMPLIQTSAKTGQNIAELFEELAKHLIARDEQTVVEAISLELNEPPAGARGCCWI
jgi:small GTP-binding protein